LIPGARSARQDHDAKFADLLDQEDDMKPFTPIVLWLALVGVSHAQTTGTQTIPVTDPNWFFSPSNWYVSGAAFAETQNTGAYFKIGFTGTSVALQVDVSTLVGPAAQWPLIRYQIDQNALQDIRLKQQDAILPLNSQALAPGPHSLTVWFVAANLHIDRWQIPSEVVRITGLLIDAGGSTSPPALRPVRMMFFGDSITAGVATESPSSNSLIGDDGTHSYAYACAAGLNAELGVVGFPGQGWTVSFLADSTNVPPFPETWNQQFAGQPRSFLPRPDYVVVMLGGGDFLAAADPGNIPNAVTAWLVVARETLASSKIFVVVEFDGYERDAVTAGFNAYQSASRDPNAFLIDLGPSAQVGIDSGGFVSGGTSTSYDGVHPTAARAAVLGAQLATAIQNALGR
jgi:lysophospholipase L1-like esterase